MRKLSILLIILAYMGMSSCGNNTTVNENPLLAEWDTPFGIPPFDKIRPDHYKPAILEGMERQKEEIQQIVDNPAQPDFENTIHALDDSGRLLGRISTTLSLVTSANTNDELQAVRNEITPLQTRHSDDIYMNDRLYQRVKEVYDNRNTSGLDPLQVRLTEKIYRRFTNAGAHLSEQGKEALRNINGELSMATLKFGNNLLEADKNFKMFLDTADVKDLPAPIRESAAQAARNAGERGRYLFTLSKSSMIPFLTNSDRRDLREMLYKGYLERCNYGSPEDNRDVINDIVRLRTEKAKILGYDTFADYVLVDRMAASPADVYALLDDLWGPALESAKAELEEMLVIMERETGSRDFESWDWWYYAEKVRKDKYALDEEMLKPYFSLAAVQTGIFELSNKLYGVTFRPLVNMPVYHKDCSVYEVLDSNNSHLGVLIMDFLTREGSKKPGAWCGSYRSRTYYNGVKTDPIVTIVCNFPGPSGNRPSLLTLDQTETFFHEFGHALHALMTDVPYRGLQGTERDFVELPSQIMENWAFEPEMLRRYALHYSTNAEIPDNLIEKINNSSHFNQGFALTEFLAAAFIDMDIHTISNYEPLDVNAFEKQMLYDRRGLIPQIEPRYRYPYFSHIFSGGYSAGYYSYMWAEVLDKDAYEAFVESGNLFDREIAASFRENVLNKGGSVDGMTMYRNFRGGEPAREPLLYGRGLLERPVVEKDNPPYYFGEDDELVDDESEETEGDIAE